MTTRLPHPDAPAAGPLRQLVRWSGRRLATTTDALLWTLGFTSAMPQPGRGLLAGDSSATVPLTHPTTTSPDRARPVTPSKDRTPAGRADPGSSAGSSRPAREPSKLQQRLTEAITAGPPDGQETWTGRALAAHVGCAPSTAWAALKAARQHQQPAAAERTRPAGRQRRRERSSGRQPTGRSGRAKSRSGRQR